MGATGQRVFSLKSSAPANGDELLAGILFYFPLAFRMQSLIKSALEPSTTERMSCTS